MTLIEIADGLSVDDVTACTEAKFKVSSNLKPIGQIDK